MFYVVIASILGVVTIYIANTAKFCIILDIHNNYTSKIIIILQREVRSPMVLY